LSIDRYTFSVENDQYEYDAIAIPFLAELGRKVYHLEKIRNK